MSLPAEALAKDESFSESAKHVSSYIHSLNSAQPSRAIFYPYTISANATAGSFRFFLHTLTFKKLFL
jgi:hypothetical protein